jgi:hypothetical protein
MADISLLLFCAKDGSDFLHKCGVWMFPPDSLTFFGRMEIQRRDCMVNGKVEQRSKYVWLPGSVFDGDWYNYINSTDFSVRPLIREPDDHVKIDGYLERIREDMDIEALASLVNFLLRRWRSLSKMCLLWRDPDVLRFTDVLREHCPDVFIPENVDDMYYNMDKMGTLIDGMASLELRGFIGGYRVGDIPNDLFRFPGPIGDTHCLAYVNDFMKLMQRLLRNVYKAQWYMARMANALVRIMADRQVILNKQKPNEVIHIFSLRWTIRKLLKDIAPAFECKYVPLTIHTLISGFEIYLEPEGSYKDPVVLLSGFGPLHSGMVMKKCACNFLQPFPSHTCGQQFWGRHVNAVIPTAKNTGAKKQPYQQQGKGKPSKFAKTTNKFARTTKSTNTSFAP